MTTIRLIVEDGDLLFPFGGPGEGLVPVKTEPSLLLRIYEAGDCDTIPFPFEKDQHRVWLALALFDERECNPFFPADATIELPDGTPFDPDRVFQEAADAAWEAQD